jgi:RNA polymerase sigma-70 factor, ECF subfamily
VAKASARRRELLSPPSSPSHLSAIDDDAAIIAQVREGDRTAFGVLVERYLPRALALGQRLMHHREDAEDLVQDAFFSALEHLDAFQSGRPFWPWLSRIIVNRGLDLSAARSIRRTELLSDDVGDERGSPADRVEGREVLERFERALVLLPPKGRLVVQLFELDGYSVSEIAELVDASPATVRWHLHVARRQLRHALSSLRGVER